MSKCVLQCVARFERGRVLPRGSSTRGTARPRNPAHYFLERGKGVGPTYPKRQTPPPHPATMSVVGIDFGNQNAVIAAAGRGGVDVILNGNSNRLNP